MTLTFWDLALYAGGLLVLFLTPGPVWLALLARAISGGFHAAWPLALGVAIGDMIWPYLAILGVSWIISVYGGFLIALKWVAVAMFLVMGVMLTRHADKTIGTDSRLTRPGMWAGFVAGLVVIIGNPKAILFYMGVLPGFFDLSALTGPDIVAIVILSFMMPLTGNLLLSLFVGQVRAIVKSPEALSRLNICAGVLMVVVAIVIAVL